MHKLTSFMVGALMPAITREREHKAKLRAAPVQPDHEGHKAAAQAKRDRKAAARLAQQARQSKPA